MISLKKILGVCVLTGCASAFGGAKSSPGVHHFVQRIHALNSSAPQGLSPDDIKNAYGFNRIYSSGLTGQGQHIAIATYGAFHGEDIQTFFSALGVQAPSVEILQVDGPVSYDESSAMETEADIELAGMIAPGASIHVFVSANNSDLGEERLFGAIVGDSRINTVVYNWGSLEKDITVQHRQVMDTLFLKAQGQGMNIFVPGIDAGSDSANEPEWPNHHPSVVSVGGTTLSQQVGGSWTETAFGVGSQSTLYPRPDWQARLGSNVTMRITPDIAFNAGSAQSIWVQLNGQAQWVGITGTGLSTSQWAGFIALVGEARSRQNKGPLGFLDPIIYGYSDSDLATLFHSVTSGTIDGIGTGPGWNELTGWGSPRADLLLDRLVGQ
jgi:kumamolisin